MHVYMYITAAGSACQRAAELKVKICSTQTRGNEHICYLTFSTIVCCLMQKKIMMTIERERELPLNGLYKDLFSYINLKPGKLLSPYIERPPVLPRNRVFATTPRQQRLPTRSRRHDFLCQSLLSVSLSLTLSFSLLL